MLCTVCDKYVCNIVVRRNPTAIIMNMLVPCFFVMLLSLLSFWSAPCNIADRASITLTLLLTQTASMQFIQEKLPDVPHMTSVEKVVFMSTMLLFTQGFMAMRVASLCDDEENHYGMMVDPGINLNPNDQYYTSRAGRCDRYTMIATYCVIVGCLIYIAYLVHEQRSNAKWIKEAHTKTFVSAPRHRRASRAGGLEARVPDPNAQVNGEKINKLEKKLKQGPIDDAKERRELMDLEEELEQLMKIEAELRKKMQVLPATARNPLSSLTFTRAGTIFAKSCTRARTTAISCIAITTTSTLRICTISTRARGLPPDQGRAHHHGPH